MARKSSATPTELHVALTLLSDSYTGWQPAGGAPGAPAEFGAGQPLALRAVNTGTSPVHIAVIAADESGQVRLLTAAVVTLAAESGLVIGGDRSIVVHRSDHLVAAMFSTRREVIDTLVSTVGRDRHLDLDGPHIGWAATTFRVTVLPLDVAAPAAQLPEPEAYEEEEYAGYEEYEQQMPLEPPDGFGRGYAAEAPPTHAARSPRGWRLPDLWPSRWVSRSRAKPPEPQQPAAVAAVRTRSAYGMLEAPDAVVAETQFEVVVGISAAPAAGVVGGPMTIPDPAAVGGYSIAVMLVAEGCRLRPGETWRNDIRVTAKKPFPVVTLHLTSEAFAGKVGARTIQAMYAIDGATVGVAVRSVAVVDDVSALPAAPAQPTAGMFSYALPADYPVADLTIRILTDPNRDPGTLLWDVDSPHAGVRKPDRVIATSVGREPREFAQKLIRGIDGHEGKPDLANQLRGFGDAIAQGMPVEVTDAIQAVAASVDGRVPTVLLLSAEAYVPWELALIDPPVNQGAPPFLGAQVALGRWVLGNRKPVLPPPVHVEVERMAVISGVYDLPGWARLVAAEDEAAKLSTTYATVQVKADLPAVVALLEGEPAAQAFHFALHGQYDPAGDEDGLKLVDGEMLEPNAVRGAKLTRAPFVYLSACQVGSGNAVLGDYAGMAAAFLSAGASGVIAPLWSVDDGLARDVALRVYQLVYAGMSLGEAVRQERASFAADGAPASATPLAYQFFGHPNMTLTRKEA